MLGILCLFPFRIKTGESQISKSSRYKIEISAVPSNWLPILWTEYHVRTFPAIHSTTNAKEGVLIIFTIYFLDLYFTIKLPTIIQGEFKTHNII